MDEQIVTVRCHGSLSDFLPRPQRGRPVALPWAAHETVKHVVEAAGVPHPEVAALSLNATPVDFARRPAPGDVIDAYPHRGAPPALPLRPPLAALRFVCDVHLGRLAAYLRMLGLDTFYTNDQDDAALAQVAGDEERVLLTRDVGLLKRSAVVYGAFVRATDPETQLREVVQRFDVRSQAAAFQRCMRCNGATLAVPKEDVLDQLQPNTRRHYEAFWRCTVCGQVYWRGSHVTRIQAVIDRALGASGTSEVANEQRGEV